LAAAMGLVTRAPLKPSIERTISLISRRDHSLSPAARQFRDFVYRSRSKIEAEARPAQRSSGRRQDQAQLVAQKHGTARRIRAAGPRVRRER